MAVATRAVEVDQDSVVVRVVKTLEHFGVEATLQGDKFTFRCPFHEEDTPSCAMWLENGAWKCLGCGRGGSLLEFVARAAGTDVLGAMRLSRKIVAGGITPSQVIALERSGKERPDFDAVQAWQSFHRVDWENIPRRHRLADYLIRRRGLDRRTLVAFDVRATNDPEYPMAIPIKKRTNLVGYVRRRMDDGPQKYKYNPGFDGESGMAYYSHADGPCLVVEGMFDLMKAAQHGCGKAAAILSWEIKERQVEYLAGEGVKSVICALDNTPTGRRGCRELKRHFRVIPFEYPGKYRKDVGDLGVNEFWKGMPY